MRRSNLSAMAFCLLAYVTVASNPALAFELFNGPKNDDIIALKSASPDFRKKMGRKWVVSANDEFYNCALLNAGTLAQTTSDEVEEITDAALAACDEYSSKVLEILNAAYSGHLTAEEIQKRHQNLRRRNKTGIMSYLVMSKLHGKN